MAVTNVRMLELTIIYLPHYDPAYEIGRFHFNLMIGTLVGGYE